MADQTKNFAVSAIAAITGAPSSATTINVQTGTGPRFPAAPFSAAIWPRTALPDPSNAEVVRVTAVTGDALTLARAQEGTAARTLQVGDLIAQTLTKRVVDNFAKRDENNTLTGLLQLADGAARLLFAPAAGSVDARVWQLSSDDGTALILRAVNDAQSVEQARPLSLSRSGDLTVGRYVTSKQVTVALDPDKGYVYLGGDNAVYVARFGAMVYVSGAPLHIINGGVQDYNRGVALGDWQDVPFNAANFSGFTVGSQILNAYTVIGHTLIWTFYLQNCTIPAGINALTLTLPGGFTGVFNQGGAGGRAALPNGWQSLAYNTGPGWGYITLDTVNGTQFAAGGSAHLIQTVTVRIS